MTFSNKALNAYEANCLKRKSLLPSHHVINTITARLHVAVFTQFLSFFLTGKTMTIEDPLEVGFYHPASGEFTAACALVCGRAVSEERRGGDATQKHTSVYYGEGFAHEYSLRHADVVRERSVGAMKRLVLALANQISRVRDYE